VAPCELEFGNVVPAGTTLRQGSDRPGDESKLNAGRRIIGNLGVLQAWYRFVRLPFSQEIEQTVIQAAIRQIAANLAWRMAELQKFAHRRSQSAHVPSQNSLNESSFKNVLGHEFFREYGRLRASNTHVEAIHQLPEELADQVEKGLYRFLTDVIGPVMTN
jgi:hypothetical protein